jgi:hypothetical protein
MISYGGLVNTAPKLKLISSIIQNTPNRNATRYNLIMQATRVYDEFMFDNIMYFIFIDIRGSGLFYKEKLFYFIIKNRVQLQLTVIYFPEAIIQFNVWDLDGIG